MTNSDDFDSEKILRAIDHFYTSQVGICIAALSKLRSAELSDKNIIIRTIMCDTPGCSLCADPGIEDYGIDFWVDKVEYVDDTSFDLYVTQAEEKVLWNIEKKGRKPGRLAVPQQRIRVRADGISRPPYIPLIYLTVLSAKLIATAMSDILPATDLTVYNDEMTMAALWERIAETLTRIAELQNDEEDAGNPAC